MRKETGSGRDWYCDQFASDSPAHFSKGMERGLSGVTEAGGSL